MIEPLFPLWSDVGQLAQSPKELTCELIDLTSALRLNRQWHSTLPDLPYKTAKWGGRTLAFAAVKDGGVYAVAVWSSAVAGNRIGHPERHLIELRRLAIPDYAPKFTASWMLGKMAGLLKTIDPELCRMLSYQQTDQHTGTIYKAANWIAASEQRNHLSWTSHPDPRRRSSKDQSKAPKVRWERQLRRCDLSESVADMG